MQGFASFPLLRLFIPFAGGVLCYVYGPSWALRLDSYSVVSGLFVFLLILLGWLIIQFYVNIKFWVTVWIDLVLFVFAYTLSYYQDWIHHPYFLGQYVSEKHTSYLLIKPADVLVHKKEYTTLIVETLGLFDEKSQTFQPAKGNILIYFSDAVNADSLYRPNAYYLLSAPLHAVTPMHNPYLFNYSDYLKKQGVYYTASINKLREIQFLYTKQVLNIKEMALYVRYKIVMYFRNNVYLSRISQSIATAFLTGFDEELDNEIIQQFVSSGTLHILSVSGFHTGLLFLLINFIFSWLDPYKRWRWIRIVATTGILFFYALMSGFSPPIVRAAIMLSLIVIQQYLYSDRVGHPLNVLSAAAFFVLLYHPLFINDVGFLLSFSAVIGLMYFSPNYIFENRFVQSVWDIIRMSIGAQIGTFPFALYFFHGFAFLFFIANVCIIPLSTVIMFVAMLSLMPVSFFSVLLNDLIHGLIYINRFFATSYTYYNWIHITGIDALMLAVFIILSGIFIRKIRDQEINVFVYVRVTLILFTLWILLHGWQKKHLCLSQNIYVYANKKQPVCVIQKSNKVLFNYLDSTLLERWAKNFLLKNCFERYRIYPFNYIQKNGKKILIVSDVKDTLLIHRIRPHILIWHNKKPLRWEWYNNLNLEKIYWISKQDGSSVGGFKKIQILRYEDMIIL